MRELRAAGNDVKAVVETMPGAEDAVVRALARSEERVLLTNDKGFAELVFRQRKCSSGIVLLRMGGWSANQKWRRLRDVLRTEPELHRALVVVTPRDVRRRALDDLA